MAITFVATPTADNVRLDLTEAPVVADHPVAVQRSVDGGATWAPVRGTGPLWDQVMIRSGQARLFDVEVPLDATVRYRALDPATGAVLGASTDVTLPDSGCLWRLGDPLSPFAIAELEVSSEPGWEPAMVVGVFWPLDRAAPIVVGAPTRLASGALTTFTEDPAERDRQEALFTTPAAVWVLRSPAAHQFGVRTIVFTRCAVERLDDGRYGPWAVTTEWQTVDTPHEAMPVVGLTWAQAKAVGTWAALRSTYATWRGVLYGEPGT